MKQIRTRYLCAYMALADATLALGAAPLLRLTWLAIAQRHADSALLVELLAANLALLAIVLAAMMASGAAGMRLARTVVTHSSRVFSQPSRALQMRARR